mmetsp:Transcript_6735/g.8725  ORF Transcript_6735/g.8725 Transcript_6735/m.8725 type:complete len:157 (-) Transcript_6735:230-700(-)|eukprot:CAMPEP_0198140638 /NCGR_PEP_ID=MMETSP1443-20131203/3775_1 /TAXON_ID=186043 /ORGANISM="Entomoneis sp., Strain CCMP2396" /LENGTH=156 /DNA_ID=CAMNT_0043803131 /DNA_START=87 /DNA_END=557 /DNA_ORIENTATION=-
MTGSDCNAACQIVSNSGIVGVLIMTQSAGGVKITGTLNGLAGGAGKRGISICAYGNLSNGGQSCGPIFNPFDKTHGGPNDELRMVGDLGNITLDESGSCHVDIKTSGITLLGPHSIIGRSMVIFSGEDDMGRGGHENSLLTGNAGPRMAAGVIGLA